MTTRCKDGDIAIIINETSLCAGNLGRIVRVRGPYQYIDTLDLHGWVIKPVDNQKMWIQLRRDPPKALFDRVYWNTPRCLPDAWLLPLRRPEHLFPLDEVIEDAMPNKKSPSNGKSN